MQSLFLYSALLSIFSLWTPVLAQLAAAPYDPSQFSLIGSITAMTLDTTSSSLLAGGTITVDGMNIIVPENTIATLPASAVAWPELFSGGSPILPGTQTWKATVFGNRVNDQLIAGLVFLAQDPGRVLQGFITSIDIATGHFTVQGTFSPAGVGGLDCVINDPLGIYSPVYKSNPLWSVDPVNPSVRATTGFPMCIPKIADDPLCPTKNRPIDPATGRPSTRFTFGDPASIGPNDPDPALMAPLMVGDYITFTGQMIGNTFEVLDLNANLGYYTAPGTKPAYISVEAAAFGIRTPVNADPPETRAVAFTTDPSTTMQWFAEDVNECSGEVTERNIQLVVPQQVAPIGRAVFRMGTTIVAPPTRNVGFRLSTGTMQTKNNITAGEYHAPVFDYVFPELTTFGANMPPLAFEAFPFLAKGFGPYTPGNPLTPKPETNITIGQLKPWPGATPPTTTACPPPSGTSSSATSAASSTSPTPVPVDTITIISAAKVKTKGGAWQINVVAQSDNSSAKLKLAVAAPKPIPASPMTQQSDGTWSLSVLSKGLPTSVTVTSDLGGSSSSAV